MAFNRTKYIPQFADECEHLIGDMRKGADRLKRGENQEDVLRSISKDAHTLSGAATMMGFGELAELARAIVAETDGSRSVSSNSDMADMLWERLDALQERLSRCLADEGHSFGRE